MSENDKTSSKKPASIKIAPKEPSVNDLGPGDPAAAPSVAPQLVDLPDPPTPSELVVKSTASQRPSSKHGSRSGLSAASSKHSTSIQGSQAGPAASVASASDSPSGANGPSVAKSSSNSVPIAREATSSKPLTGPSDKDKSSSAGPVDKVASSAGIQSASSPTASTAMQADSGAIHDEDEEGEGEVEHPGEGTSPMSPGASGPGGKSKSASPVDTSTIPAPTSHGGGTSKASFKTGGRSGEKTDSGFHGIGGTGGKKKKKVTKFRYHKRITVRTSGKTSPSAIMEKVHKKDHKATLTPSTIEDMDPQELMRRAGIKGSNKAHWRVRLRQTKRLTKNGKTTTQTKVAYRDSEGNQRIKTSSSPDCKDCGKKLEDCKCSK